MTDNNKILKINSRPEIRSIDRNNSANIIKEQNVIQMVDCEKVVMKTSYRGPQGPRGDASVFNDLEIPLLSTRFLSELPTGSQVPDLADGNLESNLQRLVDDIATQFRITRTLLNGNQSNLNGLATVAKTNLVLAVNELKVRMDNAVVINDTTKTNSSTWSSNKIQNTITAALNGILNNAPTALDTLKEIADALGNDPDLASNIIQALDVRLRFDAAQTLSDPQKDHARLNIGAVSTAAVGDTDFDYVALFNDGLI